MSTDEMILIFLILSFACFCFLKTQPVFSFKKAKERIDNLTINDFDISVHKTTKEQDVKELKEIIVIKKDKDGEIYYYVDGILYPYGSTPRITLVVADTGSWDQTYRITKEQYDSFLEYVDGIDKIDIECREIHIRIPEFTIAKNKLRMTSQKYYAGKKIIPYLNEDSEYTESEIEKILLAVKEELKEEERWARVKSGDTDI